jgi:hypothetical protein
MRPRFLCNFTSLRIRILTSFRINRRCDLSQEELLALLKGITNTKPPSPKLSTAVASTGNDWPSNGYMAPSAAAVLAGNASSLFHGEFEAEAAEEASPEGGTLSERFVAKAWKWRQAAYSEAKDLFERSDGTEPFFRELAPLLADAANDSNASAFDSALSMIVAWCVAACKSVG